MRQMTRSYNTPWDINHRDLRVRYSAAVAAASFCLGVPMELGAAVLFAAAVHDISRKRAHQDLDINTRVVPSSVLAFQWNVRRDSGDSEPQA